MSDKLTPITDEVHITAIIIHELKSKKLLSVDEIRDSFLNRTEGYCFASENIEQVVQKLFKHGIVGRQEELKFTDNNTPYYKTTWRLRV